MPRHSRTPEETHARGACRALVHGVGSSVKKTTPRMVRVEPCEKWPQGIYTAFHGWRDLYRRLELCLEEPELVTDGVYIEGELV